MSLQGEYAPSAESTFSGGDGSTLAEGVVQAEAELGASNNPSSVALGHHSRGSSTRTGRLHSTAQFRHEEKDELVSKEDLHSEAGSSRAMSVTASTSTDPRSSQLFPGPDWPDTTAEERSEAQSWTSFITAYAAGRWDPFKTPLPPRPPNDNSPRTAGSDKSSPAERRNTMAPSRLSSGSLQSDITAPLPAPPSPPSSTSKTTVETSLQATVNPKSTSPAPSIASRRGASSPHFNLLAPASIGTTRPELRASGSDPVSRLRTLVREEGPAGQDYPPPSVEHLMAAATVRWAGAGIDVAPLALPSPELELTDPMRRVILGEKSSNSGALPAPLRNHTEQVLEENNYLRTPLESMADAPPARMVADNQSVLPSPNEYPTSPAHRRHRNGDLSGSVYSARSPWGSPGPLTFYTARTSMTGSAASAPLHHQSTSGDYFGDVSPGATTEVADETISVGGRGGKQPAADISGPLQMPVTADVMPFIAAAGVSTPGSCEQDSLVVGSAPWGTPSVAAQRMGPDPETWFTENGYLIPPFPPDEMARRKALYRFNILHSANDLNFDRIALLTKLVFRVKMVVITLIDNSQQWHKSEFGLGASHAERTLSFCAHTILQRTDEPHVVFDATKDWRFSGNPLVTGGPNIRFYAGAPLRTQDGYNIGTLCLVDDEPREEFSPRSRHTLKEFAAIVMRELELWRDKIQLRIRDRIQKSMEQFTRECLEMDPQLEDQKGDEAENRMHKVYQEAAVLVKKTLDLDGALVLDVSHFEAVENYDVDGKRSIYYHGDLYDGSPGGSERCLAFGPIPLLPILGQDEEAPRTDLPANYSGEDHSRLSAFLSTNYEGKIYDRLPSCFKSIVPTNVRHSMIVPVFNVDKRPFLLLCAYTTRESSHVLESFELQFLRAVGVIILSAVLKRRMMLADTAKSLFISNISHELRTPLHGILASAELLQDTQLSNAQESYLKTVEACAQSLVETVNHVLDFTKLSGNARERSKHQSVKLKGLDLKHLLDDTVEGCWLGAKARAAGTSEEIGSVYSPPKKPSKSPKTSEQRPFVETVTDIAFRKEGWWVKSDRGGIQRILMNLIGNSLKFTEAGFIHIRLRELPPEPNSNNLNIELSVFDSGKGISKDFLQNRIFQPFSQENPLQTGTGLGLAIVNTIAASIGGKVDVWSAEGVGTEIRILMQAERLEDQIIRPIVTPKQNITVAMLGFDLDHQGVRLLRETMTSYLESWFGFTVVDKDAESPAEILLINEETDIVQQLMDARELTRPLILLSSARGEEGALATATAFEGLGGWCRLVFKPCGPVRLEEALRVAVGKLAMIRDRDDPATPSSLGSQPSGSISDAGDRLSAEEANDVFAAPLPLPQQGGPSLVAPKPLSELTRRRSDENHRDTTRPALGSRGSTFTQANNSDTPIVRDATGSDSPKSTASSTVALTEDGSVMLKSALGTTTLEHKPVVLLVDDNQVNRNLLGHWLTKRGFEFKQACDGQEAVEVFSSQPAGFFDVLLLDLSMPRMDGFEAAIAIRDIETKRNQASRNPAMGVASRQSTDRRSKIFALTGLASMEDKRKAFAAGVDGYLIKPVSLKTLDGLFKRLMVA